MILLLEEVLLPGRATRVGSMQWLQPLLQQWLEGCGPGCSSQSGQAHVKPHVQPEPANDATALSGGMVGNEGKEVGKGVEGSGEKIGGSSSRGCISETTLLTRLCPEAGGVDGRDATRLDIP